MDLNLTPQLAALVPLTMALVAIAKQYINAYYAPVLSLALGIGGAFLYPQATWQSTLVVGIVVGATASGFYSQGKTISGN